MSHEIDPWFWGFCGAVIYACPRWVIRLSAPIEARPNATLCTLEMLISLAVGSLAAGAFGAAAEHVVLTTLHLREDNATCASIGLLANRVAPIVVEKGSSALDSGAAMLARVLKALKGEET